MKASMRRTALSVTTIRTFVREFSQFSPCPLRLDGLKPWFLRETDVLSLLFTSSLPSRAYSDHGRLAFSPGHAQVRLTVTGSQAMQVRFRPASVGLGAPAVETFPVLREPCLPYRSRRFYQRVSFGAVCVNVFNWLEGAAPAG
jgi:hypothetical protein